jgi:hypothetical protein
MSATILYTCAVIGHLLSSPANSDTTDLKSLRKKALHELNTVLKTQQEFIKVHAAEYLIWLGHKKNVRTVFLKENELHGTEPRYRIGIWRVLAQTETNSDAKMKWVNQVLNVFGDMNAPDRLHSAETLGKLHISPLTKYPEATQQSISGTFRNLSLYTLWATSYQSKEKLEENRRTFLKTAIKDDNKDARLISSYILRRLKGLNSKEWRELATKALEEPDTSSVKISLLTTAFITVPDKKQQQRLFLQLKNEISKGYESFPAAKRIELAAALAENGSLNDIPLLVSFLENKNTKGIYDRDSKEAADVRAAAAYAILKLTK